MIYLVEDDDSIRDFVIYTLNSQGMEARGLWPALRVLGRPWSRELPALVILDLMLPEEDGLHILKRLRESLPDGEAAHHCC